MYATSDGHTDGRRMPITALCPLGGGIINEIQQWNVYNSACIVLHLLNRSVVQWLLTSLTRALRECKPPPMPKFQPKVIWDSNPDCQINPGLDVCWICPKMLWIHYLVGVSHFAKYGTNRPLTVWEMLTNVHKFPVPQWWRKWQSDPESTRGSGPPSKVNHF